MDMEKFNAVIRMELNRTEGEFTHYISVILFGDYCDYLIKDEPFNLFTLSKVISCMDGLGTVGFENVPNELFELIVNLAHNAGKEPERVYCVGNLF